MPTWIGPNNGAWADSANWSGGVPDAVGAVATFNFFSQASQFGILAPVDTTLGVLNVNNASAGFVVQGSSATAAFSNLTFDQSNGNPAAINHNSTGTLTFSAAGGLRLWLNDDTQFNAASTGRILVACPVYGAGAISKIGPGELRLTATNGHSGGTDVLGGQVTIYGDQNLGSGWVTLANGGTLLVEFTTTIDNPIGIATSASPAQGSGTLLVRAGMAATFTGAFAHQGSGTFTFGSAGATGWTNAAFTAFGHNPTQSSFAIAGGVVSIENSQSAGNLFNFAGTGTTAINSGAFLHTSGFLTTICNLDLNGGTIYTNEGALNLRVSDRTGATSGMSGTIRGTTFADSLTISVLGNGTSADYDLSATTFTSWTAGSDWVSIYGSSGSNGLIGSAVGDRIYGQGGLDLIQSGGGDDEIVLVAGNTGSWADGGSGTDKLTVSGGGTLTLGSLANLELLSFQSSTVLQLSAAQFLSAFPVNTTIGGTGTLELSLTAGQVLVATALIAEAGNAVTITVNGNSATEVIKLALGFAYTVNGGAGGDQIRTGNLVDTINGGDGNDKIMGLGGADLLTGGIGADQFRYLFTTDSGTGTNADQILDWTSGSDKLDFRTLDANPNLAGRQALTYVGTGAFSASGQAEVRWADLGADLRVYVDLDGNGTSDMEMLLVGAGSQTLGATDFWF